MTNIASSGWLPDWRNESEYTDHGDYLYAWAWEFLRRNPDYQADYARWAALPDEVMASDGMSCVSPKYKLGLGDFHPMFYCQPAEGLPAIDGETVGDYEKRTEHWPELLRVHFENKWGMRQLADPADPNLPWWSDEGDLAMPPYLPYFTDQFFWTSNPIELDERLRLLVSWPEEIDRHVVTISFDLRFPIDDQITEARKILADAERPVKIRRMGIPQEKKRLTILRVLDAKLSGATADEVMDELYEGKAHDTRNQTDLADEMLRYKEAFDSWHKEKLADALKLVNGGYRNLLKWHQLPTS